MTTTPQIFVHKQHWTESIIILSSQFSVIWVFLYIIYVLCTMRMLWTCWNVKKSARHPKFKNWFCENTEVPSNISTRGSENRTITKFNPVQTRTNRYAKSRLPYLTEVLNNTVGMKTWWECQPSTELMWTIVKFGLKPKKPLAEPMVDLDYC